MLDNADTLHIFGQLKTALLMEHDHMEWSMQPVLEHLELSCLARHRAAVVGVRL